MEIIKYRSDRRSFFSNVLALFRTESSSDCKLISQEGISIDVHRVMMLQSPYLTNLLNSVCCCHGSCAHQEEVTLMLPDIEYSHLEPVIDYLYTGVLSVAESERHEISEIFRLFQVPLNEASLAPNPPNKEIECPECSEQVQAPDLLDHLLETHIKAPCLRDMRSVHSSNNTAVKCSQHKNQNPNQSCDIDANIQVISNGYFNYAGKKDPLDIVLMHYKVHFDRIAAWVMQNPQFNSKSNFGDLFKAEIWKDSILIETVDKNNDEAMDSNEVNNDDTNDTCEHNENFEPNEESDSHSGGMSDIEEKAKNSSTRSKSKSSIFWTRSNKLSLSKNKRKADKNNSVRRTKCLKCSAETDSSTFRKHLVTHFYDLWSDSETSVEQCPYRTCNYTNNNKKYFIQHLAITHEELDEKLKELNETIADYEIVDEGTGPCSGIEGEIGGIQTLMSLPRSVGEQNGFIVHDIPDNSNNDNTRETTEEDMIVDDDDENENAKSDESIATEPLENDDDDADRMNDFE